MGVFVSVLAYYSFSPLLLLQALVIAGSLGADATSRVTWKIDATNPNEFSDAPVTNNKQRTLEERILHAVL
jgi:hypothetical protein